MRFYKKRYSLLRDLTLFISVVMLIVATYFIYRIHTIQSQFISTQLSTQAERVEKIFLERVHYTASILGYMGRQIRQNTEKTGQVDLYYIDQLFQAFGADPNIQNMLSYTIIGWVNTDYKAIVDGALRVMKKPIDLSSRDYIPNTVLDPWVIKLGQPVIGSTSGKWILPAGVGVADSHGKWLGSLIIGFQQSYLQKHFEKILDADNINVALLDLAGQIIVEAPTHFISNNIPLADKIKTIPLTTDLSRMEKTVPFYNIGYFGWGTSYYYYKIPNYDYVIILSLNKPVSFLSVGKLVISYLPETFTLLMLFLLGLAFLKMRIIKPIVTLSHAAHLLSEGKSDITIPPMNSIEADYLAGALERVKTLIKNEQTFTHELTLAHQEIKLAKESLEQHVIERTSDLQKALQAKTEFLNNISHEMRTPVHGVMNFSDILVEFWSHFDDEKRLEIARDLQGSSERLHSLVNNLLDMSKYKADKMTIMVAEADIADVTAAVMHDCRPLYLHKKDITLKLDKAECSTLAVFDKNRIMQVIRNLTANAIKFTDSGTITAQITLEDFKYGRNKIAGIRFSLHDEGKGVPEDELEEIFVPFSQSSRTKTGAGGTGLGLSISKEIIDSHKGRIWAENNPDGKGSTFSFILPVHGES